MEESKHPFERRQTRFIKNDKKKYNGYEEKIVSTDQSGSVKFFDTDKGYGFMRTGNTQDVFFHVTKLPAEIQEIEEGMSLLFDLAETRKGFQAVNIRVDIG